MSSSLAHFSHILSGVYSELATSVGRRSFEDIQISRFTGEILSLSEIAQVFRLNFWSRVGTGTDYFD